MRRFARILNLYNSVVGALACMGLSLSMGYIESAKYGLAGRFNNPRNATIITAGIAVLIVSVLSSLLLLVEEVRPSFVRWVVVPAHLSGGVVSLGLAFLVTPTNPATNSTLGWLAAAALYLLAASACISAFMQLHMASSASNKRSARTPHRALKAV